MKKNLLLGAFLFGSLFTVNAQLNEGFEAAAFPPAGWTLESTNTAFTWQLTTESAINGTQSIEVQYDENLVPQQELLISPSFTVPTNGVLTFMASFSYFWAIDPNDNYDFIVYVSTDGGANWTEIWDETQSPYTVAEDSFTPFEAEVSLASYQGQDVVLGFEYSGVDGAQFVLDDIMVAEGSLSTKDHLASKFEIYPNPVKDIINISNTDNILVNNVIVTDLNGRTVKSLNFDGVTETQINVSDLAAGVYMMNVTSDKGNMTKKIVKN